MRDNPIYHQDLEIGSEKVVSSLLIALNRRIEDGDHRGWKQYNS